MSSAIVEMPAVPIISQCRIDAYHGCSALVNRSSMSDSSAAEYAISLCIVFSIPISVSCIFRAIREFRRARWVGSRRNGVL